MNKLKISTPQVFLLGIFLIFLSLFMVGVIPSSITGGSVQIPNTLDIITLLSNNTTSFLLSSIGAIMSIISGITMLFTSRRK
jgi:ABC-type Fe3+ transport system permease subunit